MPEADPHPADSFLWQQTISPDGTTSCYHCSDPYPCAARQQRFAAEAGDGLPADLPEAR